MQQWILRQSSTSFADITFLRFVLTNRQTQNKLTTRRLKVSHQLKIHPKLLFFGFCLLHMFQKAFSSGAFGLPESTTHKTPCWLISRWNQMYHGSNKKIERRVGKGSEIRTLTPHWRVSSGITPLQQEASFTPGSGEHKLEETWLGD